MLEINPRVFQPQLFDSCYLNSLKQVYKYPLSSCSELSVIFIRIIQLPKPLYINSGIQD